MRVLVIAGQVLIEGVEGGVERVEVIFAARARAAALDRGGVGVKAGFLA